MENWKLKDIIEQELTIPNGTVNKPYRAVVDLDAFPFTHVAWQGLEEIGLAYHADSKTIEGVPEVSGDIPLKLLFTIDADTTLHEKVLHLIINPDPRRLWKELPSDEKDPFWKPDNVAVADQLGDKRLVAASKRGRSHAHNGAFRDDDFAYCNLENGWSIIVVADGAGSSQYARRGAQLACSATIEYFQQHTDIYGAPQYVHDKIKAAAEQLADYHTTLAFVLFRKMAYGYEVKSFSVGDGPMAIVGKELLLLNKLDAGEFGGGTRFITQPEIFQSKEIPMASRFQHVTVPDMPYLLLMTDGIYDPKFEVEVNLQRLECWQDLLADLRDVFEHPDQLSAWMDFWSQGNHDDRTLAIIY